MREGDLVDPDGRVLAVHAGAASFTVGQRRGLGFAGPTPSYVLEVDADANRVVVGPKELLARRGLHADRVTWVAGVAPDDGPLACDVRIRYRGEDVPSLVEASGEGTTAVVTFLAPQRGVAPGQSVVFYRGDELLGGGRILDSFR
jgi:tRNA-specific 2-thiouridylase